MVLLWVLFAPVAQAALPEIRLSVLQFGTADWELAAMKGAGFDKANGFKLTVQKVANLGASHLAVTSGSADAAVADLLWTQSQYARGMAYRYLPFSASIGEIVVPAGSPVRSVSDLKGLRLGIAGGPDSKGWKLLLAKAGQQNIDLEAETTKQYAAPPLLNEGLRRGQLDAVVTYWHFAARLKSDGRFRSALSMKELLQQLKLDSNLPMLGYVFREDWADSNPSLVAGFDRALKQTMRQLRQDQTSWEPLRSLMQATDDETFEALRDGFIEGMPAPLTSAKMTDLRTLLELLGTPTEAVMPERLFYQSVP